MDLWPNVSYPDNAGVRAFTNHYNDVLEAFTNPAIASTPAKLSVESSQAARFSDEMRKKILGLKQTNQNVPELLEEIEISLRLDHTKFLRFVENLRKENANNTSVQELCDNLRSTFACNTMDPNLMLPISAVPSVDISRVPDDTLDISHLPVLVTALRKVHQWFPLGIYLGLSDSALEEIHIRNQGGNEETCVSEMLAMWLQGPKWKCNKQFLQTCLQRAALTPPRSSAPSTSNPREYICQVFYMRMQTGYEINIWIAVLSFFPKSFLEEVTELYLAQYFDVGPTFNLELESKPIMISAGKVDGWSCEFSDHNQVSEIGVEYYTGVGKPPYCEMTLRADHKCSRPLDLTLPVTLTGVKQPTTIILKREAQQGIWKEASSSEHETDTHDSTQYMCQVFYHKEETNHWTVTVAFLSIEQAHKHSLSIASFYQDAITGPVSVFQFKKGSNASVEVGVVKKTTAELGWDVAIDSQHNMVTRAAVDEYASVDHHASVKPPCCVMTFQPRYKGSIPPDLSVSLTLTGGKLLQPITLERKAESLSPELSSNSSKLDFQEKPDEQDLEQSQEKSHEELKASAESKESTSSLLDPQKDYTDPDVAKTSLGVRVEMEITNIGTQGYPGVGKTSVLDLAMGKEPAPTRNSTDCVDPPSRYLMIDSATEGGVEWENVTTGKMFEMVCEAVKKTIDDNPPDIADSDEPTAAANQSTSDTEHELPPQASNASLSVAAAPSPDVSPYSGFTVFPELLKELSTSESSDVIFNSHWMMVTDCGGQPPFLDAAALFLRNSCLQIFPVKLNEPLSKRPELSYFYKGVHASFDEDFVPLTHKQIIETLAKSVASIQPPYTPSATKCPEGAKFTIVGTFEDEAHKCSELVKEKESILKKVLEPYKRFQVQLSKKVILPINAVAIDTETKKERTESAKKLGDLSRKSALDVSMKINMKLRWFGLLLSLLTIAEKENRAVLTLDECYQLGVTLGMDKSETKEAIQFFHDISLIMYFDTPKLRGSVIIDTKPVLNKLSRLISVSFLDEQFLADHYDIVLPSGAKELLQYHGRFSRDTLEKCVQFTEPITLQFFLDILEHVKIAVAIDKESEYFMPCALSYAPEASVSKSSPPWVIRLRVRQGLGVEDVYIPIPVGYLPAVVVFLMTKFASHFSTDRCQRQYRNMIKLRYKRGGFVYLIERHLQLEIYFSCFEQLPEDCTTIRDLVLESIHLTEEKLHIIQEGEGAITKVDSFICSCGKGSAHHTCAYNPLSGILECEDSEETGECCKLDPQHLLWIGNKSPTATAAAAKNVPGFHHTSSASCPQGQAQVEGLRTLNHPLSEVHFARIADHIDDWRAISPFLGLTAADESAILGEAPHSVPTQRVAMLRRWKQLLGKRATYEQLRQVFEQCRRTDLVEIVQQLVSSEERTQEKKVASKPSNTALGIGKLVEVKNTLKRVNDWQSLGLQLGLLYPTLEQIETDYHGKFEQCKTKMIAAWIKRQDNVLQVGVPTWSVLQTALREIEEDEVANQIVTC